MPEQVIHVHFSPYPRCYVYIHYDPRYTYIHINPRKAPEGGFEDINQVVYVGKGTRARAWVDTRVKSADHRRWIRDLQNQGYAPDEFVRIVRRKLTSEDAFKFERELIAFYREKGGLLFNKERGWNGPVRTYINKWMPDPEFGKLRRTHRLLKRNEEGTEVKNTAMTESAFKKAAVRTEDERNVTYDLRAFEDQQEEAVAWYLGKLMFELSAHPINSFSKALVLLVDTRFMVTPQLGRFAKKLKAARLPVEFRYLSPV